MIYFLLVRNERLVKIGYSSREFAFDRKDELRNQLPCVMLELIAQFPGSRAKEAGLHRQFGHLRLNDFHGLTEFFRYTDEIADYIDNAVKLWVGPTPWGWLEKQPVRPSDLISTPAPIVTDPVASTASAASTDAAEWPYIARNLDVRWLPNRKGSDSAIVMLGERVYYRLTPSVLSKLVSAVGALWTNGKRDEAAKGASILSPLIDWLAQYVSREAIEQAWATGGSIPDDGRIVWELASIDQAVNAEAASRSALDKWVESGGICAADIDMGSASSEPNQHRRGRSRRRGKQRTAGAAARASAGL